MLMRAYIKTHFDAELVDQYLSSIDENITKNKLYFVISAFMFPKYTIKSCELNKEKTIKKLLHNKKA